MPPWLPIVCADPKGSLPLLRVVGCNRSAKVPRAMMGAAVRLSRGGSSRRARGVKEHAPSRRGTRSSAGDLVARVIEDGVEP